MIDKKIKNPVKPQKLGMAIRQIVGPDTDSYKNPSKKMADSRGFRILIFGGFRILSIF